MYITGTVYLIDDGKSINDATVTVKATGQVARTNVNGTFTVNVPDFDSVLVFDFAGMTLPKELPARDVTGQTIWLQYNPEKEGPKVQIRPDYKLAYFGLGIAAVLGITALILSQGNSNEQKKVKSAKEVEI